MCGYMRGKPRAGRERLRVNRCRLGESGGQWCVSRGRLFLSWRSSVRCGYTRVIDTTAVVRKGRGGCSLAVNIGSWISMETLRVRWRRWRWSVNLLGLGPSRATVTITRIIGVARRSKDILSSTKKVVGTSGGGGQDGSHYNEYEEHRIASHIYRGKRARVRPVRWKRV
ncbi:hypothetical protein EI94DRAFT_1713740 [Lactarius quietus]|nr:hypothetical protein EI94DRAFT_1713740 [Lactarius quietus]